MADIATQPVWQALDGNGNPLPGAKATFFLSGTTTPQTVYSDAALTVPHPSPLLADASGRFPPVYVGAVQIKAVVTTSAGAAVYTVDPVPKSTAGGTGAAQVSFAPTASITALTVQAAIEQVQANLVASSTAFVKTLLDDTTAAAFLTTLGGTATGQAVFTAADDAAARATLNAHPMATTTVGAKGQFINFSAGPSTTYTLPAGGTWLWYFVRESTTSGVFSANASGVSAGGSTIVSSVANTNAFGWAWKIT